MDTKKLRQKILDLAIRGKLVPQDPNDEPASVLLERIKEEKERLIKEGKIRKSKRMASSDTYHYENKYLPKGWTICSLDDLATFGGGKTPSMDNRKYWNNAKHLWITSKDMKFAHIADSLLKISDGALDQMTIYSKGTLLIVTRSGILRHTFPIAILDTEATVNQDVKAISCVLSHIHTYLYYVIKAQEQVILKDYHKDGTTVDSIDFDKFKKLIVPLPPLSEQYRIVEEIEHWFALIDQIEQGKTDLQTTIKQIKGKILDLAIHGKLVPQDPNDESAIELLKRINPDFTPCDNRHSGKLPYKIPKTWVWCSHNSILDISGGSQPAKSYFETIPKPNCIRLYQIRDYGESPVPVYIPINLASKQTKKGDILLARYGGSLGKVYYSEQGAYNVAMAKVIFKFENLIYKEFAYYYYLSDLYQGKLKEISRTAQTGFNITDFNDMYFPLPPINEQQRIVQKMEKLFSSLDDIQKNLEV